MATNPSHLTSFAQVKALGSPVRQTIWQLVTILQPVTPGTLQQRMGLERHALYYHLRILEKTELVTKLQDERGRTTYRTEVDDIVIDQKDSDEWKALSSEISKTSFRRLSNRITAAMQEPVPSEGPNLYLGGFLTLFLDHKGRQILHDRLNALWDDLVELQHAPDEGEKPYFLAFGFAPESYGHDS